MKILLINQFFWPDASATSQMLTDLARGLADRGHEVHSISASGGYSDANAGTPPPVSMRYVPALPFVRGRLGRLLSYASFYVSAAWAALTMPRVDLVLTLTTPPLLSLLGNAVKRLRGSRHFIWEMDMYPDVAVDCEYIKADGWIDRIAGTLADLSREYADGIIALGECMRDRLLMRGTPAEKIHVSYNWADSKAISVLPFQLRPDRLTILYSGNLGLAHDLTTIFTAIRKLRSDERFRFVFVGNPSSRPELTTFAQSEEITSIELRPYADREKLSESLAVGDIGLVTQKNVCSGTVVPSKVYGLLAAGRPVLFIGPATAMPARIIREFRCGWHIPVGSANAVTSLLLHLADHPDEIREAGARGREALISKFDLPIGVERIAEILGASLGRRSPNEATSGLLNPSPHVSNS